MGGMKKFNEKHIPKSIRNVTGVAATDKIMSSLSKKLSGGDVPPMPAVEPVPVMPLPDDEAVMKAKRKSQAGQAARKGRVSTIFTAEGTGLGG